MLGRVGERCSPFMVELEAPFIFTHKIHSISNRSDREDNRTGKVIRIDSSELG